MEKIVYRIVLLSLLALASFQFYEIQKLNEQLDRSQCQSWIFRDILTKVISISSVNAKDLKEKMVEDYLYHPLSSNKSFEFKAKSCTYSYMTIEWNDNNEVVYISEFKP